MAWLTLRWLLRAWSTLLNSEGVSLFSRPVLGKAGVFLSMSLRFIVVELGTFSPKF